MLLSIFSKKPEVKFLGFLKAQSCVCVSVREGSNSWCRFHRVVHRVFVLPVPMVRNWRKAVCGNNNPLLLGRLEVVLMSRDHPPASLHNVWSTVCILWWGRDLITHCSVPGRKPIQEVYEASSLPPYIMVAFVCLGFAFLQDCLSLNIALRKSKICYVLERP